MTTIKRNIKKAQGGTKEGRGTYFAFPSGRVGRTYPIYKDRVEYQSMDTTGYSKGKKNFNLTTSSTLGTKSKSIPREEVPAKINEMKKGATKTQEYKKPKKSEVGSKISKAEGGKWIQKAIKKPGALRKQLGAKPGKPIPAGKLKAAAKKSGKIGQRARLAMTLKKMSKKK